MKNLIKKIFSPRNLGAVIAILIVTAATAAAAIPAYKSWLLQGSNLYTTGTNVGLGTANPGAKLDIVGDIRWSGTLLSGAVPWANVTGFIGDPTPDFIADDGTITLGVETTGSYDSTPDTIADDGVISDGEASDVLTINNGLLFAPTSGNVGIGTTGPGEKLGVLGIVQSLTGGFRFPDSSLQTKTAVGGGQLGVSCPSGQAVKDIGTSGVVTCTATAVATSAVCGPFSNCSSPGVALSGCSTICNGLSNVVAAQCGVCTVTSSTGSCQASATGQSICCVCKP